MLAVHKTVKLLQITNCQFLTGFPPAVDTFYWEVNDTSCDTASS